MALGSDEAVGSIVSNAPPSAEWEVRSYSFKNNIATILDHRTSASIQSCGVVSVL